MAESQFIPSFANGLIQDPNTAEVTPDYGALANTITEGNDNRLSIDQVLNVKKNPGAGEFSDVAAAMASITDATSSKRYAIRIHSGNFSISSTLTIKEYVYLIGNGISTRLSISDPAQDLIHMGNQSGIENIELGGSTGIGAALIRTIDRAYVEGLRIRQVFFTDCYDVMDSNVTGFANFIFINLKDSVVKLGSTIGNAIFSANGASSSGSVFFVKNFEVLVSDPTANIAHCAKVSGPTNTMILNSVQLQASNGATIQKGTVVENDATLFISFNIYEGLVDGLDIPNTGSGTSRLNINSLTVTNASGVPVSIQKPDVSGFITGAYEFQTSNIIDAAAEALAIFHTSSESPNTGLDTLGDIYQGVNPSQRINLTLLTRESATVGLIEGGVLTNGTLAFEIDVSAGTGFIDDINHVVQQVSWSATTLTIPADSSRYVTVNDSGVVQLEPSLPDQYYKRIILGRVSSGDNDVVVIESTVLDSAHHGNQVEKFLRTGLGPLYLSGSLLSENATTNRSFDITSGEYVFGTTDFNPPAVTGVTFARVYRDGLGAHKADLGETIVPNNLYDNGTGTLASVPVGEFVKHTVFILPQAGGGFDYAVLVGQATYSSLGGAADAPTPNLPSQIKDASVYIGQLITQEGAANFADILDIRPRLSGAAVSSTNISDHGSLSGLSDNDHPQYLLRDGTSSMTGNLDLNGNDILNPGDIPGTATAPPVSNPLGQANAEGVSSFKARADHIHNIQTGDPVTIGTSNSEGTSTSAARADHVHNHGDQPGGSLHADVAPSLGGIGGSDGFMTAQDKEKLDDYPATPSGINHNTLTNLAAGDVHTQYLPLSGVRSMAANLNMGGFSLINVNLVDGVDVSAHAARHLPSGADPLTTATASTISATTTNTEGAANSFSRSDHTHNISTGNVSTQTPDQTNAEGISANLARADHIHNIPAAAPEGSLGGNSTNTEGGNPSFARSNHTHDLATGVVTTQTPDQTNAEGTSNNLARADHIHNIPAAIPEGSLGANTINTKGTNSSFALSDHLHDLATGVPVTQGPDNANAEGSSNNLARADHVHNIPAASAVNVSDTNAEGASNSFSRADHTHNVFPVFNTEFSQTDGTITTTSGTYQTAQTLTTVALPLGDYKIEWFYEISSPTNNTDIFSRVQLNNVTDLHQVDGRSNTGGVWFSHGGFYIATGVSGAQTIEIDYRTVGGPTVEIRRRRLFITRIA